MVETPLLDRAAIKGWPGMSTQKLAPLIGGKGRERTHESGYLSATLQGGTQNYGTFILQVHFAHVLPQRKLRRTYLSQTVANFKERFLLGV